MTRKLPVLGTSAASTAFCAEKVEGPDGHLWIDGNGKITWRNGTLDAPKPNAFSLLQIDDCPHSTPTCRAGCYVHNLEKHAPATHALYRHNSQRIREILADPTLAEEWAHVLGSWISFNAAGGFRWHVSGDVFSMAYACWIADVCEYSMGVRHWIYTRSFPFVPALRTAPNLTVNLSADRDNWGLAEQCVRRNPGTRICYMTSDGEVQTGILTYGDVIFPDYNLRDGTEEGRAWFESLAPVHKQMVCPVDYAGKAEERRCGPCPRCLYPASTELPR